MSKMLFSFKGRINRKPYWMLLLVGFIGMIITTFIDMAATGQDSEIASPLFILIILWPFLAMHVKRWHDRDKSGWWFLIGIIPIVGPIWALVETGFLTGTEGTNRFGDNPLKQNGKVKKIISEAQNKNKLPKIKEVEVINEITEFSNNNNDYKKGQQSNNKFKQLNPLLKEQTNRKRIKITPGITSEGLNELKETIYNTYQDKKDLTNTLVKTKSELKNAQFFKILSYFLLFGFFTKKNKRKCEEIKEEIKEINEQINSCKVDININFDEELNLAYNNLIEKYNELIQCEKIWDITSSISTDKKERSGAQNTIIRKVVKFSYNNLDIIDSNNKPFHLENANGGDLYIYPTFIIINKNKEIEFLDLKEIEFFFMLTRFIESEKLCNDTETIDRTWKKVNKNGTRDKRFKGNYQIPIVKYGKIILKNISGLNEEYTFSNYDKSSKFSDTFLNYINILKSYPCTTEITGGLH